MKMKEIRNDGYKSLYDANLKDAFGRKMYLGFINDKFNCLIYLISKREQEQKRKKYYNNYQKMVMMGSAECIDITKETFDKIVKGLNLDNEEQENFKSRLNTLYTDI